MHTLIPLLSGTALLLGTLTLNATPIDSTSVQLGEVVVSAKRWQEQTSQLSQRAIAMTSSDVRLAQPLTTADLLGATGQVFIQKSQLGGGSPMIRGFATNRLLYVFDGVRMNNAIFRAGNIQNVISIDPYMLERTEVLFGAHSVLYGSDAIGGVMSFRTIVPQYSQHDKLHLGGTLSGRYSSASGERTYHGHISIGGKRLAWLLGFTRSAFGDLRQGQYGPDEYLKPYIVRRKQGQDIVEANPNPLIQSPSGYEHSFLTQKLLFQASDLWTMELSATSSWTTDYARYDRHTRLRKGKPRYAEWNYGPQRWTLVQFVSKTHGPLGICDASELRAAVQHFEESRIDRAINDPIRTTQRESVVAGSINADLQKQVGQHLKLYYGGEWVINRVSSTASALNIETSQSESSPHRYPQSRWSTLAVYADATYQLSSQITLDAGARYTHGFVKADFRDSGHSFVFDPELNRHAGSLSGNLGLVYRFSDNYLAKVNLSRAFRLPNVDDLGKLFDPIDGSVVVPSPDLKPEYAHGIELGIGFRAGRWLEGDASAYYTHLSNALAVRPGTLSGASHIMYRGELSRVLTMQNATEAEVYGIQISARAKLPYHFGLDAQLSIQHGTEEMEDGSRSPMRHAAPMFGRASLSYQRGKLRAELYSTFQGERSHEQMSLLERDKVELYARDAEGRTYAPGWAAFHLRADYQLFRGLHLSLGLENITDRRYRYYSSGISASGRSFIAAATYSF